MVNGCKRQIYWPRGRCERGVALAMLLWFLAAMTMLVASIGYLARIDIKLTQLQVAEAKAKAAGDGAIRLMLAEVLARDTDGARSFDDPVILSNNFVFSGTSVRVDLIPLGLEGSELVNINTAPPDKLQALFNRQGDAAQRLTDEVVEWRTESSDFRAIEDLLLLEGVNRVVFESLRDSAYVMPSGGGRAFRLDAYITEGDRIFLRRRWVTTGGGGAVNLPWQYFRTEAIRAVSRTGF